MSLRRKGVIAIGLVISTPCHSAETVSYEYDAKGRLVKVIRSGTVNNGVQTEYNHDKANNRTQVKTTGSTAPPP